MNQHFHSAVCNVWTTPSIAPRVELLRAVLGERSELGGEIGVALEVAVPTRHPPRREQRRRRTAHVSGAASPGST